jgi:hypothetical protein
MMEATCHASKFACVYREHGVWLSLGGFQEQGPEPEQLCEPLQLVAARFASSHQQSFAWQAYLSGMRGNKWQTWYREPCSPDSICRNVFEWQVNIPEVVSLCVLLCTGPYIRNADVCTH